MKFYKHRLILLGMVVVAVLVFIAIFAPLLAPYDPYQQNLAQGLSLPSAAHWMGQDKLGRDIFSRILYGARISVMVEGLLSWYPRLWGFCWDPWRGISVGSSTR